MPSSNVERSLRQPKVFHTQLSLMSLFHQRQANTGCLAMSPFYVRRGRLSSAAGSLSKL